MHLVHVTCNIDMYICKQNVPPLLRLGALSK